MKNDLFMFHWLTRNSNTSINYSLPITPIFNLDFRVKNKKFDTIDIEIKS